ncbi:MAG: MFS transporter [Blautia sp.]|nr:MFS transporter [Blautia sp.]
MKLFTNSMEQDTNLGAAERVSYGLGNFANAFMFIAIMAFLTFYYTNVIGLSAGVIGTIMLVSRIFDGVTDLVMGYIIDHSKPSKLGKARGWLLKSCIPYAISGVLVFMVPQNASTTLQYIFVFITYNVCNSFFYTAVAVSYNTLMVRMTRNSMERGILGIFLMVMSTMGGLVVTSTCLSFVEKFGGDAAAWTKTILIYSVIGLCAHLLCIFGTRERVVDEAASQETKTKKEETPGFAESFKYLAKNKYWMMFVFSFAIYWVGYTLMNAGHIYYAQYILGDQGYQPVIANVIQVVTLVAMLVSFLPMKVLGKARSVQVGAAIAVIAFALQIFAPASYPLILVCSALKGLGYGLFCAVIIGMNADALDYGQWKYGKNVTGMGVAAVSFGQKVGSGLGSAIFGLVLSRGGYDGSAAELGASTLNAIKMNYTWLPLLCAIISLVLMLGYNLDSQLPKIQEDLKQGKTAQN